MIYEIPRGVIVLEGPDACGKTTLASAILTRHGGKYIHLTYRKNPTPWQFGSLRRASRYFQDQLVVIDRHWISEQVYSRVYRHGSSDDACARACYGWLKAIDAVYVLCCPENVESVVTRHKLTHLSGREMYKPDDRIRTIGLMYNHLWRGRCGYKCVQRDTIGLSPLRDKLMSILNGEGLQAMNSFRYDIDKDGKNVIDVADEIVARLMMHRGNR